MGSPSEERLGDRGRTDTQGDEVTGNEQIFLVELERLFTLEDRLRNLKNALLKHTDYNQTPNKTHPKEGNVMYVPVVEIKEKSS